MKEEELYEEHCSRMSKIESKKEENIKHFRDIEGEEETIFRLKGKSINTLEILAKQGLGGTELSALQETIDYLTKKISYEYEKAKEGLEGERKKIHLEEEEAEEDYRRSKERMLEEEDKEEVKWE